MPASYRPKKGTTKFLVTYDHGKNPITGKRQRTFDTVNSEKEAKRLVAEHNYNEGRGMLMQPNKKTLGEHLEDWLTTYVSKSCEKTTLSSYKNIIYNHIIPKLGHIKLNDLKVIHLDEYYTYLADEKQLSDNTRVRHHAVIRKALDMALKQQLIPQNIADSATKPKERHSEIGKSLTEKELKKLLNLVKGTKLEVTVYLAACLGLRRGEIAGLKWENIDFDKKEVRIRHIRTASGDDNDIKKAPKTKGSNRRLSLTPELIDVLQAQKQWQTNQQKKLGKLYDNREGYVVVKEDGRPYRVNYGSEQFTRFVKMHDLPKIRLHDLRHTFAILMYMKTKDVYVVSKMLGHSDITTTTNIYLHSLDSNYKEELSLMSEILAG